jgi:hypothetical protein
MLEQVYNRHMRLSPRDNMDTELSRIDVTGPQSVQHVTPLGFIVRRGLAGSIIVRRGAQPPPETDRSFGVKQTQKMGLASPLSTREQADSGISLEAQRAKLTAYADRADLCWAFHV